MTAFDKDILYATKGDFFILIVPISKEKGDPKDFWTKLFSSLKKWNKKEWVKPFYLGIGGKTLSIADYYVS
ncbi:hypothetical protein IOC57_12500 [Bacillus sp. SD075]|uniref:hypothetical protein n=1 Tax=Bacillus sp. SD075 TaxID=2781732 RepID=UPI001A96BF49|nr:hypothetical protein [Bacillus sp. SD075]MBO0998560.1 hypothetical protein [Bacillus sp. SD075]